MRFDLLTLHPAMVEGPLAGSILGRARDKGLIDVGIHDIRDHTSDRHRTVDDTPYGGGAGMVMKVDIVAAAIAAVRRPESWVILLDATGQRFGQADAQRLSGQPHLVLVCGHYEGIDARIETLVDEVLSVGDFVLTGGEIPAMAVVDAVARLVPEVLGNAASPQDESFSHGLLEYPQYTRPRVWEGHAVPDVLVSGHHARIDAWRKQQAERRTRDRRPDLWDAYVASSVDSPPEDSQ